MDIILLLKAVLLGIIEGLTEFLPISSTGHLIIAGELLNFNDEKGKTFEIAIQLGAILAVCWEYRVKIGQVIGGLRHDAQAQRFATNLLVAFLPAALLGLAFSKIIKAYLFNPAAVAAALIVGGIVILWSERRALPCTTETIDALTWRTALKIGFAQALALFPGVSRSGATIIGSRWLGLSRLAATEFSFFLAIPTLFAATFYDVFKHRHLFHATDIYLLLVGGMAAFISGFFAVRGLLRFIAHHDLSVFGWYRIGLGSIVLLYFYA